MSPVLNAYARFLISCASRKWVFARRKGLFPFRYTSNPPTRYIKRPLGAHIATIAVVRSGHPSEPQSLLLQSLTAAPTSEKDFKAFCFKAFCGPGRLRVASLALRTSSRHALSTALVTFGGLGYPELQVSLSVFCMCRVLGIEPLQIPRYDCVLPALNHLPLKRFRYSGLEGERAHSGYEQGRVNDVVWKDREKTEEALEEAYQA